MGAAYGGVDDVQFTYQESADFIFNSIGGPFVIGLLDASSLGSGFENATFQTFDNGNLVDSRSFSDLISAEAFFSNNLLDIQLRAGLNDIQLLFSETVGRGQGFSFNYAVAGAAPGTTPLPATLPLFATGLGVMGLLGWRRKRRGVAAIADA
jgi:hypothetical protein